MSNERKKPEGFGPVPRYRAHFEMWDAAYPPAPEPETSRSVFVKYARSRPQLPESADLTGEESPALKQETPEPSAIAEPEDLTGRDRDAVEVASSAEADGVEASETVIEDSAPAPHPESVAPESEPIRARLPWSKPILSSSAFPARRPPELLPVASEPPATKSESLPSPLETAPAMEPPAPELEPEAPSVEPEPVEQAVDHPTVESPPDVSEETVVAEATPPQPEASLATEPTISVAADTPVSEPEAAEPEPTTEALALPEENPKALTIEAISDVRASTETASSVSPCFIFIPTI